MNRNTNWGYLPDYSSQNHTLRFARQSRNNNSYHDLNDRIPFGAWVGAALFAAGFIGVLFIGAAAGF